MAATVSAWSKPGAWALDSEENESELQKEESPVMNQPTVSAWGKPAAAGAVLSDFPSLAAAATTKTKKKKPQAISLQEFATFSSAKQSQAAATAAVKTLTPEEALMLPTGPRERTAEELDASRLGGGFRSYGYDRNGGRGGSDEPRRQRGDSNREFTPSRADETDDWGATKKFSAGNGFERRERGERGGFFSDSHSKADESDNWGANKAFVPSSGRKFDRRGSFGSNGSDSDSDKWTKRKEFGTGVGGGGAFDSLRERRGGYESNNGVDSESWGRKREEIGGGAAGGVGAGGGRPKLNLQPRTLPISEGQQQNGGNEVVAKPKGSNPFGAARPREEVLKEKGQDWKEIDEKLESLKVKEVSESSDGVKKAWGSPNGKRDDRTVKSWRKPEPNEVHPSSADETVNGDVEEAANGDAVEAGGEPQI